VFLADRFQKLLKALFFCPAPKMKEAPSFKGAFLVPATPPSGSHRGVGTLRVGVCSSGQLAVLPLSDRLLLRQHRT